MTAMQAGALVDGRAETGMKAQGEEWRAIHPEGAMAAQAGTEPRHGVLTLEGTRKP